MRYRIESRLQDEGWKYDGQEFDYLYRAVEWAKNEDGFFWGMIRVVDMTTGQVMAEFPAISAKEKQNYPCMVPADKPDYTKKGDSMVRKEYIYAMLGAPIVQLEIDDSQYKEIVDRVKRVMDVYRKKIVTPAAGDMLSVLEEEGVLAHVKYVVGRIRAKYNTMPGQESHLALDGLDLAAEGLEGIRWWYDMLESC